MKFDEMTVEELEARQAEIAGMATAMKTGIGSYAVQIGDLKIGAIVVVNALGDIYDWRTGQQVAGLLTEDKIVYEDGTVVKMTIRNLKNWLGY